MCAISTLWKTGSLLAAGLLLTACDISGSSSQALGTLERDRIAQTAVTNEVVVELPVAKGSTVNKGTILVRLDDTYQQAIVSKTRAQMAQAKANLDKLETGPRKEDIAASQANVAGSKASLVDAQATYKRQQTLVKRKLASQSDLDQALANRDSAQAKLNSDQQNLNALLAGNREEDIRIASAELKTQRAQLAAEKKKLADLTIRATRDGVLDNLPWNLGERVTVGSPVAILLANKAPYARIYIPEPKRVNIHINDTLTVHVDGLEQAINGKVTWVSSEPAFTPYYALNQEDRANLMYLAEVQLPDDYTKLPSGIPVQVDLP
ncbi:HlyD family efflux transporter periplasmic adaptor subunit [Vibrio sp. S11_S32]|uniref:HlyD family secretion protein n=1 Tax=Vibrio sp. S11_S32 TaxID=2720225 RepID=UPI001681987B|nr:HlyD family efflux transporter periplasmic adaptor subunit [Vibrio sp. S11_S32]MBD1577540.1 HlyD family efflux transporter periplasmic adaptor subunit [Vibrio sp. S11_S32]